ncbi:hypothetical protein QUC31_003328, partial [Theobroma cacao]
SPKTFTYATPPVSSYRHIAIQWPPVNILALYFANMSDPKYAYPYPAQGYYQGPPVMAPPQYAAPPPKRGPVLQLCVAAVLLTSVAVIPPSSL